VVFRRQFSCCLSALLNNRLGIEAGYFDSSTAAVTSKRSVNTRADLISVKTPI